MPERPHLPIIAPARKKRSLLATLGYGCALAITTVVAAQTYYVLLAGNFRTVLPGKVYRSGQLSGKTLEEVVTDHHIRTVVNLRGCSIPLPWYIEESRATHHLNVAQEDICFSANRLPSSQELRRLVEVLDRTEYPILLHCRHGADRTGLASAVVLLLQPGISFHEARGQLAIRFGHFAWGHLRYLDRFFDLYADWLIGQGLVHSPDHFREWLATENFPGECRCRVEALQVPETIVCGQTGSLRVRIHNTGVTPWQFRSGTNAGFHAGFIILDEEDHAMTFGRAGLLDALVLPGRCIDVTLVLPPISVPGHYRLRVDMMDEQQGWFFQMGNEPWECDINVESHSP
jgi:hypothetical protein